MTRPPKQKAKTPVPNKMIPYMDKKSPFKEKNDRVSPLRDNSRRGRETPSPNRGHSKSPTKGQYPPKASDKRPTMEDIAEKNETIKKLTKLNDSIKQENDLMINNVNQKVSYLRTCIRNLIISSNKLSRFLIKRTPDVEAALRIYENDKTVVETYLHNLVIS